MDALTALGAVATASAILFYHLEPKHSGFVLAFAGASAASAVYGFVQGAWPFGVAEIFWVGVAMHRWTLIKRHSKPAYLLSKAATPRQPSRETPLAAVSSARCHAGAMLRVLPPSTYVLDSNAPRGLAPDTRVPGIEVAPTRIASGY
jgi:hypothetical protein